MYTVKSSRFQELMHDFWIDERDYYGDVKASIVYLAFWSILVGAVVLLHGALI